jgi:ABC-type antimicrobial peptide transport system permease subunit
MTYDIQPYSGVIQGVFDQQNMIASLTWLFGAVGLVLATIGLYGVTAYGVEQRRSEIGVRMAVGANRGSVVTMVLRGAFWQVGIGLGIGIPAAIAAGYLMATQLFGVKPWILYCWQVRLCFLDWRRYCCGDPRAQGSQHRPDAGASQRIIHSGVIQINDRRKMARRRCSARTDTAQF